MKKQILFLTSFMVFLLGVSLASATLCKTSSGYYEECSDKAPFNHRYQGPSDRSSASYYKSSSHNSHNYNSNYQASDYNYNSYNDYQNNIPIFKGPYGNYRYQMYAHGDYRPSIFFRDYPDYGYFSSYGYSGYPYNAYGYFSYPYFSYGYGYYNPIYYSAPYFSFWL